MNKKFSFSAITLIVLLSIRFAIQSFLSILSLLFQPNIYTFVVLASALLYLTAFIGIIMKTRWALIVTIIIGTIDIITSLLFSSSNYFALIAASLYDIIIIVLSIKILRRI